jgi:hypothetical protein
MLTTPSRMGQLLTWHPRAGSKLKTVAKLGAVVGYSDSSLIGIPLHRDHPDNQPFKAGSRLLRRALEEAGLGVCLQDFRAARRATAAYVPFFAFRVIEDIGLAFSKPGASEPAWDEMNAALGTSKAHWQPLTNARKIAAHQGPLAIPSPTSPTRNDLLALARSGIERWIGYLEAQASHELLTLEAVVKVRAKRATTVTGWTP